ncbi:MAG: PEGA domain-containing protein [Desulfobulbaceae bacterium]|nr:PEGA domain-containing protein [Desulfobulbaceae bacterium]
MLRKMISIFLLLAFTSACAQKTAFFSDPPGAQVFVNGEEIGRTPCDYHYKSSTSKIYLVEIQENGYEPLKQTLATDEVDRKARAKWRAAGLVWSPLLIGSFFTKKLKEAYHFLLSKVEDDQESPDLPNRHAQLDIPDKEKVVKP